MSTSNPITANHGRIFSTITVNSGSEEIAIVISGRFYKGTNTSDDPDEIFDVKARTTDGNLILLTEEEERFAEAELLSSLRN